MRGSVRIRPSIPPPSALHSPRPALPWLRLLRDIGRAHHRPRLSRRSKARPQRQGLTPELRTQALALRASRQHGRRSQDDPPKSDSSPANTTHPSAESRLPVAHPRARANLAVASCSLHAVRTPCAATRRCAAPPTHQNRPIDKPSESPLSRPLSLIRHAPHQSAEIASSAPPARIPGP